jgi:hypothetical protein
MEASSGVYESLLESTIACEHSVTQPFTMSDTS